MLYENKRTTAALRLTHKNSDWTKKKRRWRSGFPRSAASPTREIHSERARACSIANSSVYKNPGVFYSNFQDFSGVRENFIRALYGRAKACRIRDKKCNSEIIWDFFFLEWILSFENNIFDAHSFASIWRIEFFFVWSKILLFLINVKYDLKLFIKIQILQKFIQVTFLAFFSKYYFWERCKVPFSMIFSAANSIFSVAVNLALYRT